MSENEHFPCYGAIPFRALRDRELAGVPLALLGIIAAHDRFGRNGQGCWASHKRLAELVGCRREAVTLALGILLERGYVSMAVDEQDARRRVYSVVYDNEADSEAFQGRRGSRREKCAPEHTDRSGKPVRHSAPIKAAKCAPHRTDPQQIGAVQQTDFAPSDRSQSHVNIGPASLPRQGEYIPLKAGIDLAEARGLPMQGDWGCGGREAERRTAELIRSTTAAMAENRHRPKVRSHA
jgi:hypothetical protein